MFYRYRNFYKWTHGGLDCYSSAKTSRGGRFFWSWTKPWDTECTNNESNIRKSCIKPYYYNSCRYRNLSRPA